jgi:FkbM family methyltransferase
MNDMAAADKSCEYHIHLLLHPSRDVSMSTPGQKHPHGKPTEVGSGILRKLEQLRSGAFLVFTELDIIPLQPYSLLLTTTDMLGTLAQARDIVFMKEHVASGAGFLNSRFWLARNSPSLRSFVSKLQLDNAILDRGSANKLLQRDGLDWSVFGPSRVASRLSDLSWNHTIAYNGYGSGTRKGNVERLHSAWIAQEGQSMVRWCDSRFEGPLKFLGEKDARDLSHTESSNAAEPCPGPFTELLFREILGGLLGSGVLPAGSIIDAGANDGADSCFYAEVAPSRIVHAVEPLVQNVRVIKRWAKHRANLRPMLGGLGNSRRLIFPSATDASKPSGLRAQVSNFNEQSGHWKGGAQPTRKGAVPGARKGGAITPFQVERIDDLFFGGNWSHETLGFAHFDLEGGELAVLEGAEHTIRRDRPVFTVEVNVHREPVTTVALLRRISSLGYTMYAVQESCGTPWADCRNVIAFPSDWLRDHHQKLHAGGSAILNLAHLAGQLVEVTADSVAERSGYPACRKGGECCRGVEKGAEGLGSCPCLINCVLNWWRKQPSHVTARLARPEWNERKAGMRPFFAGTA